VNNKIEIIKLLPSLLHVVRWELANGANGMQQCGNIEEARIYAAGFADGFKAVAQLVGGRFEYDSLAVRAMSLAQIEAEDKVAANQLRYAGVK